MEKQKVPEAEVRRAVDDYVARMKKLYFGVQSAVKVCDFFIDCPKCGSIKSIEPNWRKCLNYGCGFVIPAEFAPPSPSRFKRIVQLKYDMEDAKRWGII